MYALRDATATVESIPLIVASIISKKGAAGLDAMIIDVKVGNGAFMREEDRARALAHALVSTGNSCGIKTRALLTDMNQPLGGAVGNSLEVEECINILRGEANEAAAPVLELSLELSAHMLVLANVEKTIEAARQRLQGVLDSGKALECLQSNIEAQGGDPRVCDAPGDFLPLVSESVKVESPRSGFITKVDTTEIGHAIAAIGGGRVRIEDTVDPTVGFTSELKLGDQIGAGEAIGMVYCADAAAAAKAARRIQAAYHVSDEPSAELKLVKEIINK
jgi:thymidine phosphorylase